MPYGHRKKIVKELYVETRERELERKIQEYVKRWGVGYEGDL